MRSQEIYILLKLICLQQREPFRSDTHAEASDSYSIRGLSAALGVGKSEVSESIRRSIDTGMAIRDRKSGRPKTNRKALLNFVTYGLKYVFPAKPAGIARGVPTRFSAPMLESKLLSMGDHICVWPYAEGREKGQSVKPLFKSVPGAVLKDEPLYEYLALIDAIRMGSPREANLAAELFEKRLFGNARSL